MTDFIFYRKIGEKLPQSIEATWYIIGLSQIVILGPHFFLKKSSPHLFFSKKALSPHHFCRKNVFAPGDILRLSTTVESIETPNLTFLGGKYYRTQKLKFRDLFFI